MPSTPKLPGQEIEKAAAEVGSAAGKSLVRAVGRVLNSWATFYASSYEAKAHERRADIAAEGNIKRGRRKNEARREEELLELEHIAALRHRAVGRLAAAVVDEQRKIERVIEGATERLEVDPERNNARDLNEDWLKRFFDYASGVDEERVLEVLMSALADATIKGRPVIPAKALDILRFFDNSSFNAFAFVARYIMIYKYCSVDFFTELRSFGSINLNIELLTEMQLVKESYEYSTAMQIGDFHINISHDAGTIFRIQTLKLTQAGIAIAFLIDKRLRELQQLAGNWRCVDRFFDLQVELGLSHADIENIANRLISEISDSTDVEVIVSQVFQGELKTLSRTERRKLEQKFHLRGENYKKSVPSKSYEYFDKIVAAFDKFDAETIPALIRKD